MANKDDYRHQNRHAGASKLPNTRLAENGAPTDRCRECGVDLGAGYLCDDCDVVEGWG